MESSVRQTVKGALSKIEKMDWWMNGDKLNATGLTPTSTIYARS